MPEETPTTDNTDVGSLVTDNLPGDNGGETPTGDTLATETPVTNDKPKEGADNVDGTDPNKKDEPKTDGAPDNYEDFKLPETFKVQDESMTEFKTFAKAHNLSQKDAQALVDLQTKVFSDGIKNIQKQWQETQTAWRDEVKADKEIGGDNYNEALSVAKTVVDVFGNDKFKKAVESTGMGNHPEFIRFLYNIGKEFADDEVLAGGAGPRPALNPAKVLYPDMN